MDGALQAIDRVMLDRAARAALRGFGRVEPNPMVGCVIGRPDGPVLATAHHERYGGMHAEARALHICAAHGFDPRGGTAWVTLEPCAHEGKTPACAPGLIEAGLARVVFTASDPNPIAQGGAAMLCAAGIETVQCDLSELARVVNASYLHRVRTARPWVIAKWAQTSDGHLAYEGARPRWITGERARRDVHRLRARVDAIITGVDTVIADDPRLTARQVRVHRRARRVVVDSGLRIPTACAIARSAREAPVLIATTAAGSREQCAKTEELKRCGVDVRVIEAHDCHVDLKHLLTELAALGASNVLVEGGPSLLGAFATRELINEAWVYESQVAAGARGAARIASHDVLRGLALVHERRVGVDIRRIYRPSASSITGGSGRERM